MSWLSTVLIVGPRTGCRPKIVYMRKRSCRMYDQWSNYEFCRILPEDCMYGIFLKSNLVYINVECFWLVHPSAHGMWTYNHRSQEPMRLQQWYHQSSYPKHWASTSHHAVLLWDPASLQSWDHHCYFLGNKADWGASQGASTVGRVKHRTCRGEHSTP